MIDQTYQPYTVVLLYPDTGGGIETYINVANQSCPRAAVYAVRELAFEANDGEYQPEDFTLVACFKGDLVPELTSGDI